MKKVQKIILIYIIILSAFDISAQTSLDWKSQTVGFVVEGYTSNNPNDYVWNELLNISQGVHINVLSAQRVPIYIEQGNNYICFNTYTSPDGAFEFMVNINVNINDNGYFNIYNGTSAYAIVWYNSASYFTSFGNYNLKVKITDPFYNLYEREYDIKVIPSSDGLYKDNYGNTLRFWGGNNPGENIPVVFSEGFDAYDMNPQQMYYYAAYELINCMQDNGFDVYLLDNKYGTQDIRNNAAGFSAAVRYISEINNNQLIIAGGVSMGGMIARYAFAKAENDGNPLPAYIFISVDSPQQGAIISQELQDYKKEKTEGDAFAEHALNNDAAKQLLNYSTYDPEGTIHDNFYNELNSLNGDGYPHLTYNIGVSFSTPLPNPNSGTWLKIEWEAWPFQGEEKSFDLSAEEKVAGSYLPIDLTEMAPVVMRNFAWYWNFIIQPWNYSTVTLTRMSDPAYISYESALDIVNGLSKFDATIEPVQTTYHDALPSEIVNDIVNSLVYTDIYIQNQIILSDKDFYGGNLFAGKNVNNYIPSGEVIIFNEAHVNFFATTEIHLKDGFHAKEGTYFNAIIDENLQINCNNNNDKSLHEIISSTIPSKVGGDKVYFMTDKTKNEIYFNQYSISNLEESGLKIFPNPHPGIFSIEWYDENISEYSIEVINMMGKRVYIKQHLLSGITQVDISNQAKGIYFLKLKAEDKVITEKVIYQ
jgi:hypothetical protein